MNNFEFRYTSVWLFDCQFQGPESIQIIWQCEFQFLKLCVQLIITFKNVGELRKDKGVIF